MDYKKKLKGRLIIAIIYTILGIIMSIVAFVAKPDNEFISTFGIALIIMGIVRIKNYFIVTRSENSIRNLEISENDERNIAILHKAKSTAFSLYLAISGTAVIILSIFNFQDIAKWISYSLVLLVLIYWICYWVYQKKL